MLFGNIFNPSNVGAFYFHPKHKDDKIFMKIYDLNPVILVSIGKLWLSTLRWVPICLGFQSFLMIFVSFGIGEISQLQEGQ